MTTGLADLVDLTRVDGLDWDDLEAVTAAGGGLLADLTGDLAGLLALAERVPDDLRLAQLCEHYDILDKIVLHDDPTGWRLRLHVFLPGYFDRPHNHRWSYVSRILSGRYVHTLYGTDEQIPEERAGSTDRRSIDVRALAPRLIRTESAGSTYTLHHSMIHSVTAAPFTTSLVVRGPAVKARFLVNDRTTGEAWWQYGAATESPEQAAAKRMSRAQLTNRVTHLADVLDCSGERASSR